MKKRVLGVLDLLLISSLSAQSLTERNVISDSSAQKQSASKTAFETQEFQDLFVTGQHAPTSAKNATYKITSIDKQEILKRGVTNLREALDNQLGIDLSQDNVYGSSVSINGISGEGIKVLVNGIPLVGRIDGKLDLSQINLNNVERIEIVKGPLSVIYGSDALGGVINIITKEQKDNWDVYAKGFYESVGQYNVAVGGGFQKKNGFILVDAGRNFFDGYSVVDTARKQEWRPKEQYFANTKFGFQKAKFKSWAELAFFRELMIDRGNLRPGTTYAFDTHFLTYRPGATLGMNYTIDNSMQVDFTIGYSGFFRNLNSYKKEMTTLNESLRPSEIQDTTVFHNINARPVFQKTFQKANIKMLNGLELNHTWTEQNRIEGRSKNIGDYAAYTSLKYYGVKGLEIQPAFRVVYNTQFNFSFVPSFNVKYDLPKLVTLRASYGMGYRTPSLKELYLNFKDSNHDINGNPNLKPEQSHHADLSIDLNHKIDNHKIEFMNTWNYNYVFDKIDLAIENANVFPTAFQYFNIKNYTAFTGQHELNYRFKRFYIGTGIIYSYNLVNNENQKSDLWSVDATGKIGYLIPGADLDIDIWYKYSGPKLLYALNGSVQTGVREGFHQLNVSASRSFWKKRISISVGGKNLLGVTNVRADNVSGIGHNFSANAAQVNWGRTFFASLTFKFSK
jgi:outer membrane receptor for ferrienterochelin and colicins